MATSQWGLLSNKIKTIKNNRTVLTHKISTKPGQSGAPLIKKGPKDELTIIAIHKGGINYDAANAGVLLTESIINILRVEAQKMGAIPFEVKEKGKTYVKVEAPIILTPTMNTEAQTVLTNTTLVETKKHLVKKGIDCLD
jgi:hypothetical protein